MGMAASQARLLSITARLTNNENSGQSISYSKQRLADQTQQITNEYNEALSATKLTVLTGFNGADANYTDISYNLMTGLEMAQNVKQYVVTDTKGRVLVTNSIADAYERSNGNYNQFLANLGYSQADINVQNVASLSANDQADAAQKIHEAWDKYFASIGINMGDEEHDCFLEEFKWTNTWSTNNDGEYLNKDGDVINLDKYASLEDALIAEGYSFVGSGYASYIKTAKDEEGNTKYHSTTETVTNDDGTTENIVVTDYSDPIFVDKDGNEIAKDFDSDNDGINDSYSDAAKAKFVYEPINYEGTTEESRDLYDYAMALTEAFMRTEESINGTYTFTNGTTVNLSDYQQAYDMSCYNSASNPENTSALTYYRNIYDKMQSSGYFTYTNTPAEVDDNHIYAGIGTGTAGNVQKSPLEDNTTFEDALRDGTLRLEYYSSTDQKFVSTTISEDNCIQEVEDERAIARAESKYNQDMQDLENKDKKLDLELKKLDTEHNALQTEYDSVKNVVDKNVESSFKTFG